MKASHVLQALLLAGACLPAQAQPRAQPRAHTHLPSHPPAPGGVLADTDLLYCAQVYAEGAALLKADPDPGVRRTGRNALRRSRALGAADIDLLNDDPARHKQASALAAQRLAAMPAAPLEARRLALRAAYVECRQLEADAAAPAPAAGSGTNPAAIAPERAAVALADLIPPELLADESAMAPSPAPLAPAARVERGGLRGFWQKLFGRPAAATTVVTAAGAPALTPVSDWDTVEPLSAATGSVPASSGQAIMADAARDAGAAAPTNVTKTVQERTDGKTAPADTPSPATAKAVAINKPIRRDAPAAPPATRRGPPATPAPAGLSDEDVLYCEQVYGEVASADDSHADAVDAARDARARWRPLNERDYDLLNESPARHSRATTLARQRLANLPAKPGRARSVALRAAYEECRGLEDRATAADAPAATTDRVRMLANRRFCRDLMQSKLKVSPKLRAAFTPSELAALDEIEKIAAALAQPMPGASLTLEQDREANQQQAQLRETLDLAVANRSDAKDPVVLALGQCHEDYVQGLLGGPDVLGGRRDESPALAAATVAASTPEIRIVDLGPVFHMREVTPAGTFDAIWFRRGQGNLYDGVWVQGGNGQLQRDVLELRGIIDGELTLYRQSYRGNYHARVRPDGTLAPGAASWFNSAAYSWSPLPAQTVRGGDLGALVHMREVTPYGNYEGLWRQRGQTGIYDVVWVFLPTGELTSDVLAVSGMARGQLIIRRLGGPGLFPLKRRADSMAYKDPASGGKVLSKWEVAPAQAVRLGNTAR